MERTLTAVFAGWKPSRDEQPQGGDRLRQMMREKIGIVDVREEAEGFLRGGSTNLPTSKTLARVMLLESYCLSLIARVLLLGSR
jgi:hypothetical protein